MYKVVNIHAHSGYVYVFAFRQRPNDGFPTRLSQLEGYVFKALPKIFSYDRGDTEYRITLGSKTYKMNWFKAHTVYMDAPIEESVYYHEWNGLVQGSEILARKKKKAEEADMLAKKDSDEKQQNSQ